MIKNYIKIAFANLMRNKFYSLINIFGLAIGITAPTTFINGNPENSLSQPNTVVSWISWKAANRNPIEALRYE